MADEKPPARISHRLFATSRSGMRINMGEDFLKLAEERYSVRKFEQRAVEPEILEKIIKAGMLAPTACNKQPQRILVIDSSEGLKRLKLCTRCHFDAPAAMLVCFDKNECWVRKYDGKTSGEIDASIVASHMMLEAASIGIGTTWVMHFNPQEIRRQFQLPDEYEPTALLVMGYPAPDAKPYEGHFQSKSERELVFHNRFKKPYGIQEYNTTWKKDYEDEIAALVKKASLSGLAFEHIGSTAIPGVKAKPIIDIIAGVKEFPPSEEIIRGIEECGYIYLREASVPDRLYFVKRGEKNFNVNVILYQGSVWEQDIAFRDYLIAHPEDAKEYSSLKDRVVRSDEILEYSKRKTDFIFKIYDKINSGKA